MTSLRDGSYGAGGPSRLGGGPGGLDNKKLGGILALGALAVLLVIVVTVVLTSGDKKPQQNASGASGSQSAPPTQGEQQPLPTAGAQITPGQPTLTTPTSAAPTATAPATVTVTARPTTGTAAGSAVGPGQQLVGGANSGQGGAQVVDEGGNPVPSNGGGSAVPTTTAPPERCAEQAGPQARVASGMKIVVAAYNEQCIKAAGGGAPSNGWQVDSATGQEKNIVAAASKFLTATSGDQGLVSLVPIPTSGSKREALVSNGGLYWIVSMTPVNN